MDPLFERRELVRNVHIHSKFIQKNIHASLLAQLKMNFEGKCSSEGYIQPNSITIVSYSIGRSNYIKGGVDYNVRFQADMCLPHQGQTFRAMVTLRSKIGIHAETPPIRVLIPRDLHIGNTDFDNVEVNQEIEFEVTGCQFKQQDRDIIVLGRLRSAIKSAPLMPLLSKQETGEELVNSVPLSTSGDEKVVTIVTSPEPEKKKTRKLKKPDLEIPNDTFKEGMVEGSN